MHVARTVGLAIMILLPLARSRADEVELTRNVVRDVSVRQFEDGFLTCRLPDGQYAQYPIVDVVRLTIRDVTGLEQFNRAEALVQTGHADRAIDVYRMMLDEDLVTGFWKMLIDVRLLQAANRAGDFPLATRQFFTVLEEVPRFAVDLLPSRLPRQKTSAVEETFERISKAQAAADDDAIRLALGAFDFLLCDAVGDPRAARVAADLTAGTYKLARYPRLQSRLWIANIVSQIEDGACAEALVDIDELISKMPFEDDWPAMHALKGRCLFELARSRGDNLAAGIQLMRVVARSPDHPAAAECLYYTALVHQRIERYPEARRLLEECLQHPAIGDELARRARRHLSEIASNPSGQ